MHQLEKEGAAPGQESRPVEIRDAKFDHNRTNVKSREGRLPWTKFFFSDHRNDPALKLCSLAARGLWVEMLSIMHDSERHGFLVINGRAMTNQQLARIVGESGEIVSVLVAELDANGVFSRDENGVIFSRRMVRDHAFREQQRELGKLGGNPKITPKKNGVKAGVKAPLKAPLKPRGRAEAEAEAEAEENQNPEPEENPPPPREGACDAPEVSEPAAVKDEDEEFLDWGERQGMPRDGLLRIIEMDREGVIKKSRRGYAKACHEKKEWPEGKRSQHKKSKSTDPREHVRTARRREFEAWAAKPYPDFDTDALIERDNIVDEFLTARPNKSVAERDFQKTGIATTAGEALRRL